MHTNKRIQNVLVGIITSILLSIASGIAAILWGLSLLVRLAYSDVPVRDVYLFFGFFGLLLFFLLIAGGLNAYGERIDDQGESCGK